MDKLYLIICELIEKIDRLLGESYQDDEVNTSLFVISNSGGGPQELTGENRNRVEVWVHNASQQNLFLATISDDDIGENRYSLAISPGDTLIINSHKFEHLYKKKIYGFWDDAAPASANAMITEFYRS